MHTAEGKLYLYVGIDRTSKFAFVTIVEKANTATACAFLDALVAAVPYKVNIVLTDNGIQFADLPKTDQGRPLYGADIRLIEPAGSKGSNIG